jgi:propanediol dehydratase small subunit
MPEYPLSERIPEKLRTPTGLAFNDISLDAVLEGKVSMEDLRVTAEALELQAQVAEQVERRQLAENLRRAAELVNVPEHEILEIYAALRPGRATAADLHRTADRMESRYGARLCAALIREAAG